MHLRTIAAFGLACLLSGCNGNEGAGKFPIKAEEAGPAKADAPRMIQLGVAQADKGDSVQALRYFEDALKADPDNPEALLRVGMTTHELGQKLPNGNARFDLFHRSAEVMRALSRLSKSLDPDARGLLVAAIYNDGCALALEGRDDKALAALAEAVDAGFDDPKVLVDDAELKSIRARPEFAGLIARIKANLSAAPSEAEIDRKLAEQMIPAIKEEMKAFASFPFTFELNDLDGKPVKLADYAGKVTIVDVWGTWCPPCKQEVPHFIALHKKYKEKGLAIVGINCTPQGKGESVETVRAFAKEYQIPYTCVIGDPKILEAIPDFKGFPTTLFLDKTGKVRFAHVGYAPLAVLETIVGTLLDDSPGKTAAR